MREALKEIALDTAWKFVEYESYEKKPAKAVSAMKKRCPGFDQEVYHDWLQKAICVYESGIKYVDEEKDRFLQNYDSKSGLVSVDDIADDFLEKYSEFPKSALLDTLAGIFIWHHMM